MSSPAAFKTRESFVWRAQSCRYDRALALEVAAVRPLAAALKALEDAAAALEGAKAKRGASSSSPSLATTAAAAALTGGGGGGGGGFTSAEAARCSVAAEAAHNLVLLYRASGAASLALAVARDFLPVI